MLPTGSISLDSITRDDICYLTGVNEVKDSVKPTDFSRYYGLPTNNYTVDVVDPNLVQTVQRSLPERGNNSETIFDRFETVLDSRHDIVVGDVETEIDCVFIGEGAGYKNATGYFFYTMNEDGTPVMLTNDETESGYHYKPTIIFTNASLRRSGGMLQTGGTRRLKGNLPNGLFKNVRVGFFLMANGWNPYGNGIGRGTGNVMHTQPYFNSNYNITSLQTDIDNELASAQTEEARNLVVQKYRKDHRRGVQSVILFNPVDNQLILAFEDILRPSGDSDFNDLVLQIKTTPPQQLAEYTVALTEQNNHIAQVDSEGMFIWLKYDELCVNESMTFEREMTFPNKTVSFIRDDENFSESSKDYILELIEHLNWNYNHSIIETTESTIKQRFIFNPNDYTDNLVNNEYVKLYLLSVDYNLDDIEIVNNYETNYEILLNLQSALVDYWESEDPLYLGTENFKFSCSIGDVSYFDNTGISFTKVNNTNLIFGDPHIESLTESYYMDNIPGKYILLHNRKILVTAETDFYPHNDKETFFTKISVKSNKSFFSIDLRTFEYIHTGHIILKDKFNITTVPVTNTDLFKAITEDKDRRYLEVVVGLLKLYIITVPSYPDIQNIVAFDMNVVSMYSKLHNTVGGLISKKLCFRM